MHVYNLNTFMNTRKDTSIWHNIDTPTHIHTACIERCIAIYDSIHVAIYGYIVVWVHHTRECPPLKVVQTCISNLCRYIRAIYILVSSNRTQLGYCTSYMLRAYRRYTHTHTYTPTCIDRHFHLPLLRCTVYTIYFCVCILASTYIHINIYVCICMLYIDVCIPLHFV